MIYHAGLVGCTKTIINIYNRNSAGTGIKHRKQSRKSFKGCPVTHTGWNCNYRTVGKATNHAGKGSFHTCYSYYNAGVKNIIQMIEQAMYSCNTCIIDAVDFIPESLCSHSSLFSNGYIRCSCSDHQDISRRIFLCHLTDDEHIYTEIPLFPEEDGSVLVELRNNSIAVLEF